ncbi:hypothetical protein [Devosia sp. Leaf420]|uniref:hypothetical protein n=1 Tax=Devosia sp. Leaf420 TaxID=1736374 RepID=UPI000ADB9452|nr:hypothetical protein [Devosia sp. Leaf420]
MTTKKSAPKETRSIVLLETIDDIGESGNLQKIDPSEAEALVGEKKARWATKADFGL